jgi:hypothetical protein
MIFVEDETIGQGVPINKSPINILVIAQRVEKQIERVCKRQLLNVQSRRNLKQRLQQGV